jgi:CRP-like cAMP-binding protein
MTTLAPLLERHRFFAGLSRSDLEFVTSCAMNVRFADGAYLAREGDSADRFFIIRYGKVALELGAPGRGDITIGTVGETGIVGFSWLFGPHRWVFDARAVGVVRAIAMDGVCLRGKCEQDPRLGYDLMQRLANIAVERLQAARLQLLDVYGHAGAR